MIHTDLPDGFHDLTMAEYLALPLVSNSGLKLIDERTPAHFRHALQSNDVKEDTASTALGTVTHSAVLEPDTFDELYFVLPQPDPERHLTAQGKPSSNPANTTAYKDEVAAAIEANPGKQGITPGQYRDAMAMRDAVHSHPAAGTLIQADGPVEATVIATDPDTGVRIKVRPDKLVAKLGYEVNLKTTRNASRDQFQRDVFHFGYYIGTSLYRIALEAIGWEWRRGLYIAVESDRPHLTAVYDADEGQLDAGEQIARRHLRTIARCLDRDEWPGYSPEITAITLPHYAWAKVDEKTGDYGVMEAA